MMYFTEETLVLDPHFQQFPTPMLFTVVCGKLHVCDRIDITEYRLASIHSKSPDVKNGVYDMKLAVD